MPIRSSEMKRHAPAASRIFLMIRTRFLAAMLGVLFLRNADTKRMAWRLNYCQKKKKRVFGGEGGGRNPHTRLQQSNCVAGTPVCPPPHPSPRLPPPGQRAIE